MMISVPRPTLSFLLWSVQLAFLVTTVHGDYEMPGCAKLAEKAAMSCTACDDLYVLDEKSTCTICQVEDCAVCEDRLSATGEQMCHRCHRGYDLSHNMADCLKCDEEHCEQCSFDRDDEYTGCQECEKGYLPSPSGQTCQPCPKNCSVCENNDGIVRCIICEEGLVLSKETNECVDCRPLPECERCSDTNNDGIGDICQECHLNYGLMENGLGCTRCGTGCTDCTDVNNDGSFSADDGDTCRTCDDDFTITDAQICQACSSLFPHCDVCHMSSGVVACDTCLSQYSLNRDQSSCIKCPFGCFNCTDNMDDEIECIQCIDFYTRNTSQCVSCSAISSCHHCYYEDRTMLCRQCAQNHIVSSDKAACIDCGENITGCNSCHEADSSLLCDACDAGFTLSSDKRQCLSCSERFANCQSCADINTNNELDNGECMACAPGYSLKAEGDGCKECSSLNSFCSDCADPSYECAVCKQGYDLTENKTCVRELCFDCEDAEGCTNVTTNCTQITKTHTCWESFTKVKKDVRYRRYCSDKECSRELMRGSFDEKKNSYERCCHGNLCNNGDLVVLSKGNKHGPAFRLATIMTVMLLLRLF